MSKVPSYVVTHTTLLTEDQEKRLFATWKKTGSPLLHRRIILYFTPIIMKTAKRLAGYGIDQEDLIGEGQLALVQAAERFDPSLNLRFATYARTWVEGLMLAYIAKNYFSVNVCSNQRMKKLFFNLRRVIAQEYRSGNPEGDGEFLQRVANKMGVDVRDVESMNALFMKPSDSLSDPIRSGDGEEGEFTKESMIPDPSDPPEEVIITTMLDGFHKKIIYDAMTQVLDEREKRIFIEQCLTPEEEVRTLQALGNDLGLSKERVRQIRDQAMAKVQQAIRDNITDDQREAMFAD